MKSHYMKLGIVLAVNTVIMFLLTYSMIDSSDHFRVNINRIYMAVLMAAPMGILMLIAMHSMFENKKLNAALFVVFMAIFALTFAGIRTQTPVGDDQFLRSMIPHHSGAILMCQQATITDAEIANLCDKIVKAQKEEIAEMEAIIARRR